MRVSSILLCLLAVLATACGRSQPASPAKTGSARSVFQSEVTRTGGVVAQTVSTGDAQPAMFTLKTLPDSALTLAAGSSVRLSTEGSGDQAVLVASIERGAAQFDIMGRGAYRDILVRGAAMEVSVKGTLFCMERVDQSSDYVALIRGQLHVRLREAVAKALGRKVEDQVDLGDRMGVGASATTGLAASERLTARPQLDGSAAKRSGLREQSTMPQVTDPGWQTDTVAMHLDAAGAQPEAPPTATPPMFEPRPVLDCVSDASITVPRPENNRQDLDRDLVGNVRQPLGDFPRPPQ